MSHDYHYLIVMPEQDMRIEARLNGFPLIRKDVTAGSVWMEMLDLHNVGPDNRLDISGQGVPGQGGLRFFVRQYDSEMIVTLEDGIDVPLDRAEGMPEALPDGWVHLPLTPAGVTTGKYRFAMEGPVFRSTYLGEERIDEATALKGAEALVAAASAGAGDRITGALWARNADVAEVYRATPDEVGAGVGGMVDAIVSGDLAATGPIEITLWCDGRLAEATINGGPLFQTVPEGPDEEYVSVLVFLGMRGGRLAILR